MLVLARSTRGVRESLARTFLFPYCYPGVARLLADLQLVVRVYYGLVDLVCHGGVMVGVG